MPDAKHGWLVAKLASIPVGASAEEVTGSAEARATLLAVFTEAVVGGGLAELALVPGLAAAVVARHVGVPDTHAAAGAAMFGAG